MNNKLAEALATKYNLHQEGLNLFYGRPSGIYTVITFYNQSKNFQMLFGATKDDVMKNTSKLLEEIGQINLIQEVEEHPHSILVRGRTSLRNAPLQESIEAVLDKILPFLQEGYHSGSFDTGVDDGTVKLTQINDDFYYLSSSDHAARIKGLDQRKESINQSSERVLLGIIGAIIGASIGGVLWTVVGHLGYIVWITGFLAIYLAFHGYRLLAGKVSPLGAFLVFVISILVIVVANLATWAWEFYDFYKHQYIISFFDAFKATPEIIFSDRELMKSFFIDLGIGVGVLFIGGLFYMRGLYQKSSGDYVTRRWE